MKARELGVQGELMRTVHVRQILQFWCDYRNSVHSPSLSGIHRTRGSVSFNFLGSGLSVAGSVQHDGGIQFILSRVSCNASRPYCLCQY